MTNSTTASSTAATDTNPSNTSANTTSSGTNEILPGKAEAPEGGPPPHPGKHEGKPSTTWTPPFAGNSGNQSQV